MYVGQMEKKERNAEIYYALFYVITFT